MSNKTRIFDSILSDFKQNSNALNAKAMSAYLRDLFPCYGIKTDLRRELGKPFLNDAKSLNRQDVILLAKELYAEPHRECHHAAVELIEKAIKPKHMERGDIEFFEWMVVNNSWWDTVDFVAPKLMGPWFLKFPEERLQLTNRWLNSNNIWLIRSAILFQLKYKDKTDLDMLFQIILKSTGSKEFFVNKAIGWILRENSKRIPTEIETFVNENQRRLSELSVREAMRIIRPPK